MGVDRESLKGQAVGFHLQGKGLDFWWHIAHRWPMVTLFVTYSLFSGHQSGSRDEIDWWSCTRIIE